jgi:hypothetical protein
MTFSFTRGSYLVGETERLKFSKKKRMIGIPVIFVFGWSLPQERKILNNPLTFFYDA